MAKGKAKRILKIVFICLLAGFVIIQFFRPEKNISTSVTAGDMNTIYPIPDDVHKILEKACFDCHSNNTRYPWYFNIQPGAWFMANHVRDGKHALNFSEYGKLTMVKRYKKLKGIAREVTKGDMPLDSYTWIHKDAILTAAEKKLLIDWTNDLAAKIAPDTAK